MVATRGLYPRTVERSMHRMWQNELDLVPWQGLWRAAVVHSFPICAIRPPPSPNARSSHPRGRSFHALENLTQHGLRVRCRYREICMEVDALVNAVGKEPPTEDSV